MVKRSIVQTMEKAFGETFKRWKEQSFFRWNDEMVERSFVLSFVFIFLEEFINGFSH